MEDLIFSCADDLFRYKGVLAIAGWPDRFIFQVCSLAGYLVFLSLRVPAACSMMQLTFKIFQCYTRAVVSARS